MRRFLTFTYGLLAYFAFFVTILWAIFFVGDILVPKTINSGTPGPVTTAIIVNCSFLALFAIQHTIMARQGFKRWITKFIPQSIERSTYVMAASAILLMMFYQWRPITTVVWDVENTTARMALTAMFWTGWALVFLSTFLINHFDLFGLRQVYFAFRQRAYESLPFRTTALYKFVRHPLLLGFVIAFWSTPVMTTGHLLFAVMTTGYILVGIQFEERDLEKHHGAIYRQYKDRVPMLIPYKGSIGNDMTVDTVEIGKQRA
jgi:protein-S-isoprenylcysteine O-methyltransferase Ste14